LRNALEFFSDRRAYTRSVTSHPKGVSMRQSV